MINPLNAKLNPICHLLALLEAHHILHVSRVRLKTPDSSCFISDVTYGNLAVDNVMNSRRTVIQIKLLAKINK
jgi:hypothetical protein